MHRIQTIPLAIFFFVNPCVQNVNLALYLYSGAGLVRLQARTAGPKSLNILRYGVNSEAKCNSIGVTLGLKVQAELKSL